MFPFFDFLGSRVFFCGGDRYSMAGLFQPDLPLLNKYFFQLQRLTEMHMPLLHEHLAKHGVEPTMYASQWFMTVCIYNFPFSTIVRVIFIHSFFLYSINKPIIYTDDHFENINFCVLQFKSYIFQSEFILLVSMDAFEFRFWFKFVE